MAVKNWMKIVVRLFGLLHLLFAAEGLSLLAYATFRHLFPLGLNEINDADIPYRTEAFFLRTVINLIFLVVQTYAGIFLLRLRIQGVRLSNVLFVSMIVYFFFPIWFLLDGDFGRSMGATAGTGDMGVTLQVFSGYPIVALIALNLARRKWPHTPATETTAS